MKRERKEGCNTMSARIHHPLTRWGYAIMQAKGDRNFLKKRKLLFKACFFFFETKWGCRGSKRKKKSGKKNV